MAKHRCLMIGGGGMARSWLGRFFPNFAERMEIVALVDVSEQILQSAGDQLGLPASRRFTAMAEAFERIEADFCTIIIPPAFHEEAVLHAARRRIPILSEKPIADTWDACCRIYRAVSDAGMKMQVVQNYRFNAWMLTMREVLRSGDLGRINYLVGRFAQDYRKYLAWGAKFRYEIAHALLLEGAVHHFDMLRNLSGGDCRYIGGWEWNPAWSSSRGEYNALYTMQMTNGIRATYEGSGTAAGEQNIWHREYYRAECERGAVVVGHDQVVRIHRFDQRLTTEEVLPVMPTFEGHSAIIEQFLDWLDGGPAPETVLADNIQSVAMVFAAIEASRANQTVDVQAMVRAGTAG